MIKLNVLPQLTIIIIIIIIIISIIINFNNLFMCNF